MNYLKLAAATLLVSSVATVASAQDSGIYGNLGINAIEFDAYSLGAKLGYNVNEYFGVEGEASFGISDDDSDGIETGVDTAFGGYAIARYPVAPNFEVFGRVGYHTTDVDRSFDDGTESESFTADGIAFGGGGQYFFTQNDGIRLEYTHRDFDGDLGNAEVYSVSYVRNF